MKIVHVITALTKGGGEKVVVELANAAARDGNQVTILTAYPADPALLQNQVDDSISVVSISTSESFRYLKQFLWIFRNFGWLTKQDIIHCHLSYGAIFGSLLYSFKKLSFKKTPLIIETYHAVGMRIPRINRFIHSKLCAQRNGVILMAEDDYWNKFRKNHKKITTAIIPNGISIPKQVNNNILLENYKEEIGIPASCKCIVGTIGMLRKDRQPWRYIPIFAKVAKNYGPDVHFLIGGDGPEMENVKNLIEEYNIEDQVHLPGLIKDTSITYSIIDIYISLSIGPLTGLSMMEAGLFQIPVVGIQLFEGYVAKENDWVWSSTSDVEIAAEIQRLIEDETVRKKIAEKQYQYVLNNHTTPVMSAGYKEFYYKILRENSSGSSGELLMKGNSLNKLN